MTAAISTGLATITEAIGVRDQITELYAQYRALSDTAQFAAEVTHADLKRAVDALHYLGGGWPSPNSKGRMEAALDNIVGMYRILDFIGSGDLVRDYLANKGITISLDPAYAIEDHTLTPAEKGFLGATYSSEYFSLADVHTLRDLLTAIVSECQELQGQICKLADTIKDNLRPAAIGALGVEDEEYDRIVTMVKLKRKETNKSKIVATNRKIAINASIQGFNACTAHLAKN